MVRLNQCSDTLAMLEMLTIHLLLGDLEAMGQWLTSNHIFMLEITNLNDL